MASEILIYQTEDQITRIEVKLDGDNVWLNQKQLAELFDKDVRTVNEHLQNALAEGEIAEKSVFRKFRITAGDGKGYDVKHYSLEAVIAIGYRVKSPQGTRFRIWALERLREYMVKGFAMDDLRLKEGRVPAHYYLELVERIQEVRTSDRNFQAQVIALFSTATDFDPKGEAAALFFTLVQDKLHWAVHRHTAPDLLGERANSRQPKMGLKAFRGPWPRLSDAKIPRNYLRDDELLALKALISQYLDFAERQAKSRIPMTMKAWAAKLDAFLQLNDKNILKDAGRLSAQMAMEVAEREFGNYEKDGGFEVREPLLLNLAAS